MSRRFELGPRLLSFVIFLAGFAGGHALGARDATTPLTVTAEDYARAEQWLALNVLRKVKNVFVTPHWIGDQDRFWYDRETADGHRFVLVEAASGKKKLLFDHADLAAALTALGVEDATAADLPFHHVEVSDDLRTVTFTAAGSPYRCELEPLACTRDEPEYAPPGVLVSPDGAWGVLTRGGNLWLHDLKTGKERRLTNDGEEHFGYGIHYGNWLAASIPRARRGTPAPPMAAEWSDDGSRILVPRIDQRHVAEYAWLETVPGDGSFRPKIHTARLPFTGEEPARVEWFVFHVPSGEKVRLDLPYQRLFHVHQDALALRQVWWNSDSSRLYTVAWGDNLGSAFVFDVDATTGKVRTVVEEKASPRMDTNSTSYNPPNVRVTAEGHEVLWFSQRDGWGHLYLYDGKSGALKNRVTGGEWLVRDILHLDEKNRRLFFSAAGREAVGDRPYDRYLYRVNLDGSDLTLLSPEPADHMLTSPGNGIVAFDGAQGYQVVSPSGRYVVYNYSRVDQPTRTVIRRTADASLVATFEECDASALYAAGWRDPVEIRAKAADGETDLHALLYLPPALDEGRKYPVIDTQYTSPLVAVVPRNFMMALTGPGMARAASLAELGFVSVIVDARGTTFRSKAFSHYSWENLNTVGLEDHVTVLQQLGERHPWIDLERVGIQGVSYGGWGSVRAMLEFPDFFKVGVAAAPPTALHIMYPDYHFAAYHGRPVYADGSEVRPESSARPVNYENADSVAQAAKLRGKLLIMLGEIDENVPPATVLAFIDALVQNDKDFDMYYFPNRPHNFRNAFSMRKVWDYLVLHLHGQVPPRYHITTWEK